MSTSQQSAPQCRFSLLSDQNLTSLSRRALDPKCTVVNGVGVEVEGAQQQQQQRQQRQQQEELP